MGRCVVARPSQPYGFRGPDTGKLTLRLDEGADVETLHDVDGGEAALRPRLGISIGATLAAARAEQRLSLAEAEQLTCLRERFLSALERDEFERLPGHAYTRAFIRTYATTLGLDADHLVEEFELQEPEDPEALAPRPPPGPSPLRYLRPLAVAAGGALLVWVVWTAKHSGAPVSPAGPAAAAVPAVHRAPVPAPPRHPGAVPAIPPARAGVVLVAARGRCWVLARRGGPAGPVLAERTVEQGEALHLGVGRVWLRLGAPWNVRLSHGGHRIALPSVTGPIDTYVP